MWQRPLCKYTDAVGRLRIQRLTLQALALASRLKKEQGAVSPVRSKATLIQMNKLTQSLRASVDALYLLRSEPVAMEVTSYECTSAVWLFLSALSCILHSLLQKSTSPKPMLSPRVFEDQCPCDQKRAVEPIMLPACLWTSTTHSTLFPRVLKIDQGDT